MEAVAADQAGPLQCQFLTVCTSSSIGTGMMIGLTKTFSDLQGAGPALLAESPPSHSKVYVKRQLAGLSDHYEP